MNIQKELIKLFKIRTEDMVPPSVGKNKPTRDDLADAFGKLDFKYGAEIGVRKGHFSIKLLKAMGNGKLILVDPWRAYEKKSDKVVEGFYQSMLRRLSEFENNIIIKRMTSMDAVKDVEDESLDFVYIDGMHDFDNVAMDLINWSPKVKKGGVVSGHDYCNGPNFGVIDAVNSYTRCHNIKTWYITTEVIASWFFVKK